MDPTTAAPTVMTGEQFAIYISRPQVRIFVLLLIVLIVGVTIAVQDGVSWRVAILIGGAVLSFAAIAAFAKQVLVDAAGEKQRSWTAGGRAAAAFIPLLFAFYLGGYEGLYKLLPVFTAFSLSSLAVRLLFVFVGYRMAVLLMRLSEIPDQLASGRIVVSDPPIPRPAV